MDYGMIGKIEKAKRYAEERDRIKFTSFSVTIQGENNPHTVTYSDGEWACDCSFFRSRGVCSHSMALERVLEGMLPESAVTSR
ncbi:MAG: SWIM zinc finger family protein [Anaerolineae bacterium]|nr:SWIM zinc finger family protein [Anaerolineae bacterium]